MTKMIHKIIICVVLFTTYATCRTARDYREMPDIARTTQADYPSYNILAPYGPGTYAFGYEIEDITTGNVQFRDEEKLQNGSVIGSYGYLTPDNTLHITRYVADHRGYRANTETRKRDSSGPLKLEVQVQPSILPKPYPTKFQPQPNLPVIGPSSTPFPEPFETVKPELDNAAASAIYQQHQINLNPTYTPLRDPNVIDPQAVNAILHHQYYQPTGPEYFGLRQNGDGTVSTYTSQTSSQNRPPFFNWFGTNNNNNNNYNGNYQSDQPQQGPILGFLTNLANNNPITNFINGFQPQNDQQMQNPFQNFLSNINPLNLFTNNNNNNNRPSTSQNLPIQSDYASTMMPSNQYPSNNIDSSVFSNDHFLNPTQLPPTSGSFNQGLSNSIYNPYGNAQALHNPGLVNSGYNQGLSVNFNPGLSKPTPVFNPNYAPQAYYGQLSTTSRPGLNSLNSLQPYSLYYQNPSSYPIYQNPYQVISPISVTTNPNRRKTNSKTGKKKNKNKVEVPETESDWFHDFLDKRKEANLDLTSRKTTKKSSDEDDDSDLDDYFR